MRHYTSVPIKHAGGEFPPKPLFEIVSGIVADSVEWAEGFNSQAFYENLLLLSDDFTVNFGLSLSGGVFDTFSKELKIGPAKNSLAYFLFRLLEQLQNLGTVPAVDWNKYTGIMVES